MKSKIKKILAVILVLILIGTSATYAVTNNTANASKETNTNNSVSNNSTNTSNVTSNTENKSSNNTTNSTKKSTNTSNKTNTVDDDEVIEDEDEEYIAASSATSKKETISDDVYIMESEESTTYENKYIDGNVYVIETNKFTFNNCEITGNVFIIADEIEFNDTKVSGSVYAFGTTVKFIDCNITSIYAGGETVSVDEDTKVYTDIRIGASESISISGTVGRNVYLAADDVTIEDDAEIAGICEVTAVEYYVPEALEDSDTFTVTVVEDTDSDSSVDVSIAFTGDFSSLLLDWAISVIVVLIIAVVLLGASPKFSGVNYTLKISSFVKAFITGLVEIIIGVLIALGLALLGSGYSIAMFLLIITLLCFGKAIFIAAFGLRLVKNTDKNPRIKAFMYSIIVAIIVEALDLLAATGVIGIIAVLIINCVLSITGLGTLVRVALTARKKKTQVDQPEVKETPIQSSPIQEVKKVEELVIKEEKSEPVQEEPKVEIKEEVKEPEAEVKEPEVEVKEESKKEEKSKKKNEKENKSKEEKKDEFKISDDNIK